jgi:hypothetical protein
MAMIGALTAALTVAWGLGDNAAAVPLISSTASAAADEAGEEFGVDSDQEATSLAGQLALAEAFRCPGSGSCVPGSFGFGGSAAYADALTHYGSNRARASGVTDVSGANTLIETASASSLWIDEWTFSVPFPSLNRMTDVDVHLDGVWNNGTALFSFVIYDPTLPYTPSPDDPIPSIAMAPIAMFTVDSASSFALWLDPSGGGVIPFAGGPTGSIDVDLTLRFAPVAGRTYTVAGSLFVEVSGAPGQAWSDFGSTGELTRVVLPGGITFNSAAGASYNLAVPEPTGTALLATALTAFAIRVRRARLGA